MRAFASRCLSSLMAALVMRLAVLGLPAADVVPGEEIWPVVELRDMSFEEAVSLLGRQAGIQVRWGASSEPEPPAAAGAQEISAFRQERVSPRAALERLAAENGWRMVWEVAGKSARLEKAADGGTGRPALEARWNRVPAGLGATNVLEEVALDTSAPLEALTTAIRESGLNILFDSRIVLAAAASAGPKPLRLEKVTGVEALRALIQQFGLALAWDSSSSVGRVTTRKRLEWELDHPLSLMPEWIGAAAESPQPLVFVDEAPLIEAVATLAAPLKVNLLYHHEVLARLQSAGSPGGLPATVAAKLRRVTLRQALVALLANVGLALSPDPRSGVWVVTRWEEAWAERQTREPDNPWPALGGEAQRYPNLRVQHVPLATLGVALARLTGVDMLWPPGFERTGAGPSAAPGERLVSFDLREITAAEALSALLRSHGFQLQWDASARLAWVRRRASEAAAISVPPPMEIASLHDPGDAPRQVRSYSEDPLGRVLEDLAAESGLRLAWIGATNPTSAWPMVEARLTGRSARETISLLLRNYRLAARAEADGRLSIGPP